MTTIEFDLDNRFSHMNDFTPLFNIARNSNGLERYKEFIDYFFEILNRKRVRKQNTVKRILTNIKNLASKFNTYTYNKAIMEAFNIAVLYSMSNKELIKMFERVNEKYLQGTVRFVEWISNNNPYESSRIMNACEEFPILNHFMIMDKFIKWIKENKKDDLDIPEVT